MNGIGTVERLLADLSFGARVLRRDWVVAGVAVVTLALGIGASTAIFSVVDGILLRSLPFSEPDRLVSLWADYRERGGPVREWLSFPNFVDAREQAEAFEEVGIYAGWAPTLIGPESSRPAVGAQVSAGLLDGVLRIRPARGRLFVEDDDQPGSPLRVVVGHGFWRQQLGGRESAVGETLNLDGEPATVIGVLPPGFQQPFLRNVEIWSTFRFPEREMERRRRAFVRGIGRLRPGVSLEAAQTELDLLAARLREAFPEDNEGIGYAVFPLKSDLVGSSSTALWMLLGGVGLTLLIVCVNLANLLLARGAARAGEITVRSALGAGRRRIVRQLLTESVLLAVVGGGLGVGVAYWGTGWLMRAAPPGTPRIDEVVVDGRVLAFAVSVTLLAGVLFGLLPALRNTRVDLTSALRATGRGERGGGRLQHGLVIAQVALALILLAGAGLLLRSFREINRVDLGFEPRDIVTFFVTAPPARFPESEALSTHFGVLEERLRALPGVRSVASVSSMPLGNFNGDVNFTVAGRPVPPPGEENVLWLRRSTPGYFETLGIDLVAGRPFAPSDRREGVQVAVVNETLARSMFGSAEAALGESLNVHPVDEPVWREIVGVARDTRTFGPRQEARSAMYVPLDQLPTRSLFLVARTDGDPESVVDPALAEIRQIDPAAGPVVATAESLIEGSLAVERFNTWLLGLFALVAVQLAAVGLFGVVSYGVRRRLREIGVRMALGADAAKIGRWIVTRSLSASAAGIALGLLGALLSTRFIASLLFETSPSDPATLGSVVLVMLAVAVLASLVPAWRAARVDPVRVLGAE